jgi:aminoglycoside phosphotransferase (APT) family kinase protein
MSSDSATAFLGELDLPGLEDATALIHNREGSLMLFVMKGGAPLYFIKVARDRQGNGLVEGEYENLSRLNARLAGCDRLKGSVPAPVLLDYYRGRAFLVSDWFPGRKSLLFSFDSNRCEDVIDWLTALHKTTGTEAVFDEGLLWEYISRYSNSQSGSSLPSELQSLSDDTVAAWGGLNLERVPLAFSHNDFSSANILFDDKESICVVDWVSATERGFVFLDAFDLALYLLNKRLNDYPESLRRFFDGTGATEVELRRIVRKYIKAFDLSAGMLRWLLQVFFLSKACRFHRAGRPDRVRQLTECFRVSRDINVESS